MYVCLSSTVYTTIEKQISDNSECALCVRERERTENTPRTSKEPRVCPPNYEVSFVKESYDLKALLQMATTLPFE